MERIELIIPENSTSRADWRAFGICFMAYLLAGSLNLLVAQWRLGTFAGCLLGCWLLFSTNQVFSPIIYAETALLSLCFGVSQGTLSSFVPLLFPVSTRATGVFFVGSLVAVSGGLGNALLFFSLTFALAFVATRFSRRTMSTSINQS